MERDDDDDYDYDVSALFGHEVKNIIILWLWTWFKIFVWATAFF
jgi:hypothetical protein